MIGNILAKFEKKSMERIVFRGMTLNANYRASLILQLDKIFMFRGKKFLPITDSLKLYDRVSKDT